MTEKEREYREERQLKAIVDCNTLTIGCVTTATVARRLGMTATALYRLLNERHILFKSDGMWMLMPKYTKLGLLRYQGPRVSCVDEGRHRVLGTSIL